MVLDNSHRPAMLRLRWKVRARADATRGSAFFDGFASAGNATFIIQGGLSGGKPGFASIGANCTAAQRPRIFPPRVAEQSFSAVSLRVERRRSPWLMEEGWISSGQDASKPLTIGSLSGNGFVLLGNEPSLCPSGLTTSPLPWRIVHR